MPYKDRKVHSLYTAARVRRPREAWIAANGPCARCGSQRDLQVDHIDPKKKISHRICRLVSAPSRSRAGEMSGSLHHLPQEKDGRGLRAAARH